MDTDDFLDALAYIWKHIKGFCVYTINTNFNGWYDVAFFVILFGCFIAILICFTGIAYQVGFDAGNTAGLVRGFENGKNWIGK